MSARRSSSRRSIDPEQHPAPAPPRPDPSASAPPAGLGNDQETREHAPAVPIASRPTAGVTPSRSWRTEECEPGTTGQAPAPTLPVSSGSHLASAPSSAEQPAGGRIWTVISVIAGLLIVTTSLLVGVHLVRDWQQSASSESAGSSSDVDVRSEPVAPAAPTGVFHWSDAVLHAQRLGLLEVKVVRVKYGAVRAKDLNNEVITTDDTSLLAITVSVHNRGAAAVRVSQLVFRRVIESADGQELLPALSDDAERAYSLLRFDDVSSIEGQRLATEIEPHQIVQDTVVFLVPTDVDRSQDPLLPPVPAGPRDWHGGLLSVRDSRPHDRRLGGGRMMSQKALVTGAGGFLGQYIAEQLVARGDHVRGLARQSYGALTALGVESIAGDIRDADTVRAAVHGMDVVFHTAAVADIWGPWEYFYSINVAGHAEHPGSVPGRGSAETGLHQQPQRDVRWHGSVRSGRNGAVSAAMAVPLSPHESARRASGAGRERSPRDAHLRAAPAFDLGSPGQAPCPATHRPGAAGAAAAGGGRAEPGGHGVRRKCRRRPICRRPTPWRPTRPSRAGPTSSVKASRFAVGSG